MKDVTVIFKSGRTASFTVEEFATFKNGFGALTKIEYTGANKKVPFHIGLSNIDAIFVEDIGEKELIKEPDYPIEDVFGEEVQTDDVYYKFGEHIVLEHNLKTYLVEQHHVECFQAQ
ncbi:hypothetical protein BK741_07230 [Bacillus thuringiensis serovar iberica]|uniref:Uncharacterized protein n=1 Tax=Bacillus thuringiensis serovar iberica TaxID=180866 RepID=A0A9X6QRC0_BACTU|nr:hypothetical protein [Bacillus thuringiensis]MEB9626014.1 hypothetical protein [Bacillus cereus]OUB43230.1 hypothetical protein BK741_23245 [Bacillus thuringiensis serovar iberica]OUB45328.1 hypothetical protein BK741_21260 [Bacillus thuringiensis serovar iberica]OUB51663.1 hypothetical protein BK741_07265 [Bacillus thuringiensis serovar iberica]OUB51997.1 hypothetical protein BK741_07230 [Bacillus thuringiensis serovar iberica]